ncbi:MAG: hypothetical protein ACYSVY_04120 [Planctomycetota bacterium]|jgi:hypothetical protein
MSKQTLHYVLTALLVIVLTSGTASAGVREDFEAVATAIEATGQDESAARLRDAVNALSDEELDEVYGEADLIGLAGDFRRTAVALNAVDPCIVEGMSRSDSGFPDAVGYPSPILCPYSPDRSDSDALLIAVDAIQAARILLESAKVIWSGLSRACDQVAVVCPAPGGGNTSVACIPADVVLFAAELAVGTAQAVVDHIAYCDGAVDSAEIEGSYERLGHFHDDWTCKFPGDAMIPRAGHGCNGIDDNCSGEIDDCGEDVFGPVVFIDPAVRLGCYSSVAEAAEAIALAVFAFDDCGNVAIGPPDVQGTECDVTVAVTATDDCGNSTTASTVVTIDGDGPSVTIDPAVADVCYASIDDAEQAVLGATTITDNCDSLEDLQISVHSSVTECALRVRVEVTDKCGNTTVAAITVRVDPLIPSVDIQVLRLGFRGEVLAFQTPVCYETVAEAEQAVLAVTHAEDNCTAGSDMVTSVSSAGNPCSLQVTSKAVDECDNENTDTVAVRVDAVQPTVTCSVVDTTLQPPNHTMRNIGFTFTATDNCTGDPAIDIFITSDETTASADGAGQTSPAPDAFILRDLDGNFEGILLRAERSSAGDGRVYEITVRVTDECGNVGSCSANVVVPPAGNRPAVDSGQFYDATQIN